MKAETVVAPVGSLRKKAVRSVIWSVIRVTWSSLATMMVFVVLTRLLDPHAFGLFALSTLFVDTARIIAAGGLADAITRERNLNENTAETAFWANLVFAIAVGLAVSICAYPYAAFMREETLAYLIPALALVMPITALGSIHTARLQREFGHKALALRTMATTLFGGVAGVTAALNGYGVWSLVIQILLSETLGLILAWYTYRWIPRLRFSPTILRTLFRFSLGMMITQMCWSLLVRVPELFIGRSLGTEAVGQYRVAWRLIDLVGQAVLAPISNVALITLSHVQGEKIRFASIYDRIISAAGLFTFPVLFGFAAISDKLVPLVFGEQWQDSSGLVRVFALMAVPFTVNYFAGSAFAAIGDSSTILRVASAQLTLTVVLSLLAAPYGLYAVAISYVFRAYLTMAYQTYALQKYIGIKFGTTLSLIAPTFIGATIMAILVYLAGAYLHGPMAKGWSSIFILSSIGTILYLMIVVILAKNQLANAIEATGMTSNKYISPFHLWLRK